MSKDALADAARGFQRHLEGCAEAVLADADPLRVVATWAAQQASPEYVGNAHLMAAALHAPRPAIEIDDCAMAFPQREAAMARVALFVALYDAGTAWPAPRLDCGARSVICADRAAMHRHAAA